MAITYLSGQRIQGIGEISGYKGWTTSGSGWSETTSDGKNIVKATNPSYTSSFHGSVYELPETVGSTFLLRWTIKVTSVTAYSSGSHQFVAWLGGLTIDGSDTAMDQTGGVGLNYGTNPSITWGGKVATGELGGGVDGVNSFGTVIVATNTLLGLYRPMVSPGLTAPLVIVEPPLMSNVAGDEDPVVGGFTSSIS